MMKKNVIMFSSVCMAILVMACSSDKGFNDGFIKYEPISISQKDKEILLDYIEKMNPKYDSVGKMITKTLNSWNYHTDAQTGTYHEVRTSFAYAVALLDCGEKKYEQRAFDVIDKTISIQDTASNSVSKGVWPYYLEEPLATKKSPIDYNWADFNAVSLLDIYMYHKNRIPKELLKKIENSLILAAEAVQKRNCGPGYTNIAIMGTYVTYVTSHLFGLTEMQEYAAKRLKIFYDYTLDKGGFSEYNSPTYSLVAIDELNRMQRNIVEPEAKKMIDELYDRCWEIIARHYHKPSAQWAGPHSRSYRTLVASSYYGLLKKASDGKIDLGYDSQDRDVKLRHHIPESLLPYYISPEYPRTETYVFEKNEPQVIGTTYLTDDYAVGSVSRSSLWNQRRPLTVYWGELNNSHYMQVRFLHDFYDFSTASIFTRQDRNNMLSTVNFADNGGDKHINIDMMKDGRFTAKDLRLRFEFGNCKDFSADLPKRVTDGFMISADGLQFWLQMVHEKWDNLRCHWEKGSEDSVNYADLVIYEGPEKDFNLNKVDNAVFSFVMSVAKSGETVQTGKAIISEKGGMLTTSWNGMTVEAAVKPDKLAKNL